MDYSERIDLVGKDRYLNDPVCHRWVHSGDDVKILIGLLLERYDCLQADWLKQKKTEVLKVIAYKMSSDMKWNSADNPPESTPGVWSRPVIAVTNAGYAYRLSCDGRYWQRLKGMEPDEKVLWWTDFPDR